MQCIFILYDENTGKGSYHLTAIFLVWYIGIYGKKISNLNQCNFHFPHLSEYF